LDSTEESAGGGICALAEVITQARAAAEANAAIFELFMRESSFGVAGSLDSSLVHMADFARPKPGKFALGQ
jgi:hypothetical protein